MVDGDPEALGVWKRFRDLSITKMMKTYARLNIHYDDYSGESQVQESSMAEAVKIMEEKGVSSYDEGAIMVDLTPHAKKLGKATVQKKDGTSLYLTRDIGAAQERFDKYAFDKMIYVVASQQDLHLAQLFKIEELMGRGEIAKRSQHINFGMVSGMSTRKGTAKFLDDILRDVGEKMHDVMKSNEAKYALVDDPEKVADVLGISAVMVQDMTGKRINGYDFDMERMTSFEGDTGPYLQYAHARLCSIMRRVNIPAADLHDVDLSPLYESTHAVNLVRTLAQWPDVFVNTLKTQEPVTVLTYLFKMSHSLSSSYEHLQVVGSEEAVLRARLALYAAARGVLGNGMRLLGLSPVERM
jgi:arginyl-tRNA synthetase